jgi:hypothetical protein
MKQKAHGNKEKAIVRALTSRGVVIWDGIPECIIEELHKSGYKIKKRKTLRSVQRAIKSSTPSL